jgi:hypothetical protein
MALLDINWNPAAKQLRQFSLLLAALLIGVSLWLYFRSPPSPGLVALCLAGAALAAIGLRHPGLMRVVYVVWMAAAFPLGWTVSHLLLAAIYYLVITPIGVIMRRCGYDPMQRTFDRDATTYWKQRDDHHETKRYFKQY